MGHDLAGRGKIHIDLAGGGSVGGRLAHPVDRPVGEVITVGFSVQAGGGNIGARGEVVFGLGDEPGRVTFDGGLHRGGIGIDEGGGGAERKSPVSHPIVDCFLTESSPRSLLENPSPSGSSSGPRERLPNWFNSNQSMTPSESLSSLLGK